MGCLLRALSLLLGFAVLPALCVVEHLAGVKMGMYRYLVYIASKNPWLQGVFSQTALRFIPSVSALLMLGAVLWLRRPARWGEWLWRLYGALLAAAGYYLFDAGRFASLRAAPWFGLALLATEALWLLGTAWGYRS